MHIFKNNNHTFLSEKGNIPIEKGARQKTDHKSFLIQSQQSFM